MVNANVSSGRNRSCPARQQLERDGEVTGEEAVGGVVAEEEGKDNTSSMMSVPEVTNELKLAP